MGMILFQRNQYKKLQTQLGKQTIPSAPKFLKLVRERVSRDFDVPHKRLVAPMAIRKRVLRQGGILWNRTGNGPHTSARTRTHASTCLT